MIPIRFIVYRQLTTIPGSKIAHHKLVYFSQFYASDSSEWASNNAISDSVSLNVLIEVVPLGMIFNDSSQSGWAGERRKRAEWR